MVCVTHSVTTIFVWNDTNNTKKEFISGKPHIRVNFIQVPENFVLIVVSLWVWYSVCWHSESVGFCWRNVMKTYLLVNYIIKQLLMGISENSIYLSPLIRIFFVQQMHSIDATAFSTLLTRVTPLEASIPGLQKKEALKDTTISTQESQINSFQTQLNNQQTIISSQQKAIQS